MSNFSRTAMPVVFTIHFTRGGGTPISGQYGYVPPKSPHFSACAAQGSHVFGLGHHKRTHLFKNMHFFVNVYSLGCYKRPPFKKHTFLCYFQFLNPLFSVRGHSKSLPFSVRGCSLSPPFLNPQRYIYTSFIYDYPPSSRNPPLQ